MGPVFTAASGENPLVKWTDGSEPTGAKSTATAGLQTLPEVTAWKGAVRPPA